MATVLLADDERLFKVLQRTLLRRDACKLVKAPASDLPRRAAEVEPDLVCLSISSPAERDVMASLRGDERLSAIPILVLDVDGLLEDSVLSEGIEVVRPASGRSRSGDIARLESRVTSLLERHLSMSGRALERVTATIEVRCDAKSASFKTLTKDICPTGMFLKTERGLACGERLGFELRLPAQDPGFSDREGGAGEHLAISGTCEVVRRIPAGAPEHEDLIPGAGVRFIDLDPEAQAALRRFTTAGSPHRTMSAIARGEALR